MKEKKGFEGKLDEQIKFYQAQVLGCSLLEDNRDCYRQKRKDFKKAIRSLVLEFIGEDDKIGDKSIPYADICSRPYMVPIRNEHRKELRKKVGE